MTVHENQFCIKPGLSLSYPACVMVQPYLSSHFPLPFSNLYTASSLFMGYSVYLGTSLLNSTDHESPRPPSCRSILRAMGYSVYPGTSLLNSTDEGSPRITRL